jgi:hypothetical protein
MSTNQLIAILAIVVSSATALFVAHGQQKQARQLEAFRRDASVGLMPPPTALWVHLRKHWQLWLILMCIGVQVACLVSVLRGSQPITRDTLVELSVIGGSIFWNLLMAVITFVQRQIAHIFENQSEIISIIDKQAEIMKLTEDVAKVTGQLATPRKNADDAK